MNVTFTRYDYLETLILGFLWKKALIYKDLHRMQLLNMYGNFSLSHFLKLHFLILNQFKN